MCSHRLRAVASLRSPITNATIWRVRRPITVHSQRVFRCSRTHDHMSSTSSTSSGSAGRSVSASCGLPLSFVEPGSQRCAADTEGALDAAQAGALVVGRYDVRFLGFGGAAFRLQDTAFAAIFAPVLLTTAGVVTTFDDVLAATISTWVHDEFGYHTHTIPYITSN